MAAGQYKMYSYNGTKNGAKVAGMQKAASKDELASRLKKKNIVLINAKPLFNVNYSVSNKEIIRFSNQMHSMIKNGISSAEALKMYADYADEDFQYILTDVINTLNQGILLSEAFRKSGYFSNLFCETIAMGEASSNLDKSFENIKNFYASEGYIKKKVKSMMTYPMIVTVILFIVTIGMSTFVLPKFGEVYADMGAELPIITKLYIRFGKFIISSWWLLSIVSGLLSYGFKSYKKGTLHRKNLDRFYLNIPLIGNIYNKILVARFSNVLSLYLKSGIQIQDSLLSSARILQNYSVYDEFVRGTKLLLQGKSFFEITDEITIFPPFYKQVVYTGERSGDLANSLVKLSETMDTEAKDILESTAAVMNQAVIIVMFFALAPTILAILLPVVNLTTVASGAGGL